ncbi:MAG: transcriptional repressor [Actinobacteria bacterium]|nr:transcriptional repressor [Actinomycetota bacterium]
MGTTVEGMLAELRSRGMRITPARRAIATALLARSHHTADSLVAAVRRRHPDVAPSTVYRFLEALEEIGLVRHSHLGHGPAVYHLADERHGHLVCESCGGVTEVPEAAFSGLRRKLRDLERFELAPGHFAVTGLCGTCQS